MNSSTYDASGTESFSSYTCIEPGRYVYEDSDSNLALMQEDGTEIGYGAAISAPYRAMYMDDAFEEMFQERTKNLSIFQYDENETVVSDQKAGGQWIFVTSQEKYAAEEAGYDGSMFVDGDVLLLEYEMAEDTLEMQNIRTWIEHEDRSVTQIQNYVIAYDTEPYQLTEDRTASLAAQLDNADSRTVTMIADPGTDKEREISVTVGKGCGVMMYLAEGYTSFYLDEACTQKSENTPELQSDVVLYVSEGK